MSEYGKQMFGVHDMCASNGYVLCVKTDRQARRTTHALRHGRITGSIEFDELDGPEVLLSLSGQFWHRRGT